MTDLDVQIGSRRCGCMRRLYLLELDLPDAVDSDNARCKWGRRSACSLSSPPLASTIVMCERYQGKCRATERRARTL